MKYMRPFSLFNDLQKMKAVERGRLLGLDVCDKYVGLAVSDPCNKIASPLSVLIRKKTNIKLMATDFQRLVNLLSNLYNGHGSFSPIIKISELPPLGFIVGYHFDQQKSSPDGNLKDRAVGILQGYRDSNRKLEMKTEEWCCVPSKRVRLCHTKLNTMKRMVG